MRALAASFFGVTICLVPSESDAPLPAGVHVLHQAPSMPGRGLNLGRLFGVRIALDWSLIIIFTLVLFSLGAGALPQWHPDWSAALTWGVAFAAAVLFFVSVLLHELSHALVAKAFGMEVRSITLFLFGGMANIEEEPGSPKAEALMAIVGPIASIVIGVVCSLGAALMVGTPVQGTDPETLARSMGPAATLLAWLGPINILLGVFNMLPGFPLDGGRVLRAAFWAATRDLRRATRWATRAGQGLGWLLIAVGIAMAFGFWFPFFGTGLVQGMWLAFIGWFLSGAATASYRQLLARSVLEDVPVYRLTRRAGPAIEPTASVSTLIDEYVMPSGERSVPVVDGRRMTGLVRTSDIRRVPKAEWPSTPVSTIAKTVTDTETARSGDDAYKTLSRMGREGLAEIPVVDETGAFYGMLRREDIARWVALHAPDEPDRSRFSERPSL